MRLLVASHDASRTGAPLVLLTFLRWVAQHRDARVQLVLWRGGPLVDAFAEVADTTVLHPPPGRRSVAETAELGLGEVGLGPAGRALTGLRARARLRIADHDALYLNGAGSALVGPHLRSTAPALAHVHELGRGLGAVPDDLRRRFLGEPRRFVAVSQRVADHLAGEGVALDRIVVVPGCVPDRPPAGGASTAPPPPDGPPLVGAVGAGSWRKGIDLFLQVAAVVHRRLGDSVAFAWVGPLDDETQVRADVRGLGLEDVLDLPGEVADPGPWYERMAVFCSTAREDPFPLSALEAGAAALPVVAFDSGGVTELLADGRGWVVGYAHVGAMADRVVDLMEDGDGGAGGRLAGHVGAHHTAEVMAPRLWSELEAVTAGP